MDKLKPCQTDEVGKLVEATAQTLDERCKIWQETLNRAYKDGKYNKNTGIWKADEYRVARARYTLDAYCDALALVDTLGQQIDDLRRTAPENKPLTLDELRQMDGEPVKVVEDGKYQYGLVSLSGHFLAPKEEVVTLCGGNFFLLREMKGNFDVYPAHKPEQEATP